jgi:phenylacetate-CoA ligase
MTREAVSATLRSIKKLGGTVDFAAPGMLPNDGRIIADERGH